jgi:hypothetical protein
MNGAELDSSPAPPDPPPVGRLVLDGVLHPARMIARWLVAVVAAVVLAPVAAAQARPPVLISTSGEAVGVAVDEQGTAHIAFNDSNLGGTGQPLMCCAWPAAAKTCTPRPILADNKSAPAAGSKARSAPTASWR